MNKRVIVIDDNKDVRTILKRVLEVWGYDVIICSYQAFCPSFLDSGCCCPEGYMCADIIMTDVKMPNMTGLEFVDMQKRKGCKAQNIAIMSGTWDVEEIAHAKRLDCVIFKKPLEIDELKKWIDACDKKVMPDRTLSTLPISIQ